MNKWVHKLRYLQQIILRPVDKMACCTKQAYKILLYIKAVLEHHATRSAILFAEKLKKDKNNYSLRYIIRFITSMGCYSNFSNTHFGNYYASTGWFGTVIYELWVGFVVIIKNKEYLRY